MISVSKLAQKRSGWSAFVQDHMENGKYILIQTMARLFDLCLIYSLFSWFHRISFSLCRTSLILLCLLSLASLSPGTIEAHLQSNFKPLK